MRAYIKQYLNRYKGGLALVAGLMIFHIFVLYICGIPAADIRYFAGLELVFFVLAAVFCGIRYWYRLRTVKGRSGIICRACRHFQIRRMRWRKCIWMRLNNCRISGRRKREHTGTCSGKWKNIMLCGCIRSKRRSPRCVCFCRGKNKNRQIRMKQREWKKVCCMTCSRNYSGLTSMSIWHFSTSG